MLALLVAIGAINFVLLKVLYNAYGVERAFFVSQGINLLYVVYGGLLVYPRVLPGVGDRISDALGLERISPAMRAAPHSRFLRMGLLDCFGTFLTAMGAVHTPGQYQPILNQSLVPATMTVSALCLGTRYSSRHVAGAVFIVSGAVLSLVLRRGGALRVSAVVPCRLWALCAMVAMPAMPRLQC